MPETLTMAQLRARHPHAAQELDAERNTAGRPDAAADRIRKAQAAVMARLGRQRSPLQHREPEPTPTPVAQTLEQRIAQVPDDPPGMWR
jgi:hypothetical protein